MSLFFDAHIGRIRTPWMPRLALLIAAGALLLRLVYPLLPRRLQRRIG